MLTHRGLGFDGRAFPGRRSRLQRAARDQLGFGIGRRWSRGLTFRSGQVPEMLDQAAPCEDFCEICWIVTKRGWRWTKLRVGAIPLSGVVIQK
jgi:hypothetical protein